MKFVLLLVFLYFPGFWGFFAKTPEEPAPPVLPAVRYVDTWPFMQVRLRLEPLHLCNQRLSIEPRVSRCTENVKWINERMKCVKLNHINMISFN